jgi:hypothetical protein
VPLVDAALLRKTAPLMLAAGGSAKRWLAAAPRGALPEAIVTRAKTGFSTPSAQWLERHPAGRALLPGGAARSSGPRRWSQAIAGTFAPRAVSLAEAD